MALENIHLRKLLKLMYLEPNTRRSALRTDIREDLRREAGEDGGGGDFYSPFWADAKAHVFGGPDLRVSTAERIAANARRSNLYPQLRDGFLSWWDERRRWTNLPFNPGRKLKARFKFPGFDAVVKIDNILTVVDGKGDEHVVYSYFAPEPALSADAARLGLWVLTQSFPTVPPSELRILDIIRGNTFSIDRTPLSGEEEIEFRARYARLVVERDKLRAEYG
ncbi:hypothetical protein [Qipengyuania profunda]|jgi:hypothetical protein|uniref:hypothetical protein n=1 Tax=Qipengyuania profunda TaxID=3113984 RepID=UPI002A189D24|nr:hypothetical protein [Qipengyuania sp. HL-TH1]WPL55763.1 hypothetical protein SD421_09765 [Qipengyuania sp. HL-TH5]